MSSNLIGDTKKVKRDYIDGGRICECGKKIDKRSKTCETCYQIKNRKVERPEKELLLKDIKSLGYLGTGRKYGVSDNAIRKWEKKVKKDLANQN